MKTASKVLSNLIGRLKAGANNIIAQKDVKNREIDLLACMNDLLSAKGHINVIQIGANDGRINDPIYRFVYKNKETVSIVLIEPQEDLIPVLLENYKAHPNAVAINGAIGAPGVTKLYSVNAKIWGELEVPYAQEWPIYRAPTGISSLSKEHVRKWLETVTEKSSGQINGMIVERIIQVHTLEALLSENKIKGDVDVLQIDTEGYDDVVLFKSLNDNISPAIINFEYIHLGDDRVLKCVSWLESRGYQCITKGDDMLCIKQIGDQSSLKLVSEQ